MSHTIRLYRHPLSGHAHRVELMLSLLQLPTELISVDLAKGAHKHPDFLALNPFGQVPVIDDDGVIVSDSNAILVYLAKQYGNGRWLPEDPQGAAFNPEEVVTRAHTLFQVMERELAKTPFLAGSEATIADVSNYSYISHAPEGNVSLQDYPNLRAWLARVEALPHFVPMQRTAIGLQA